MKKYIIFNKKNFSYVIFILCLLFFSGCGQEPEPVHNSDPIESVPPQESAKVDITDNLSEEEIIELYRVKIKEIAEELEIPYSVLDMVYNISSEIVSADE